MATLNVTQLKELIKESIKEIFKEQEFINLVISESVKAAISSVLKEYKTFNNQPQYIQPTQNNNNKKRPDLSMFAQDLQETNSIPAINGLKLKEDSFIEEIRRTKPTTIQSTSGQEMMEETESDPDWLLNKLGLK